MGIERGTKSTAVMAFNSALLDRDWDLSGYYAVHEPSRWFSADLGFPFPANLTLVRECHRRDWRCETDDRERREYRGVIIYDPGQQVIHRLGSPSDVQIADDLHGTLNVTAVPLWGDGSHAVGGIVINLEPDTTRPNTDLTLFYPVTSILWTTYNAGDSNKDDVFDQLDVLTVLQSGKYLTGEIASWRDGDWNGDGRFDQLDIVEALPNYVMRPAAALAVPEPSTAMLTLTTICLMLAYSVKLGNIRRAVKSTVTQALINRL